MEGIDGGAVSRWVRFKKFCHCSCLPDIRPLTIDHWPLTIDHQPLTIDHKPSIINHWPCCRWVMGEGAELVLEEWKTIGSTWKPSPPSSPSTSPSNSPSTLRPKWQSPLPSPVLWPIPISIVFTLTTTFPIIDYFTKIQHRFSFQHRHRRYPAHMLVSQEHGMIYTANYGGSSFSTLRLGPGGEVRFLSETFSQVILSRWAMWSVWKISHWKGKTAETRRIHIKPLSKVFFEDW